MTELSWEYLLFCTESGKWNIFIDKFKKEFSSVYSQFDGCNFLVIRDFFINNPKEFDKLKQLYKDFYKVTSRNDNYYSMTVLSKPQNIGEDSNNFSCPFMKRINIDKSEILIESKDLMCLYTGDFPARDKKCLDNLKNHYMNYNSHNYWKDIKTLQVPHHGSRYDNPEDLYDIPNRYCVISYGTNNRFHHPSGKTLLTLHYKKEILVPVNENVPFTQVFIS